MSALAACDVALAGWEAGSAAFGRADEASDLDVGVLCAEGGGRAVLDAIEDALRSTGLELDLWDVGPALFGVQRFWQPADPTAQLCMVDVSVIEHVGQADHWRELLQPERHGRALPLYDPEGVLADALADATFDVAAHRERMREELARIRARRTLFGSMPAKERARGRVIDGAGFHHGMVVMPLVALLGMWHRPLRFDFGLRYLHEELPADASRRLAPIVAPGAIAERASATVDGLAWIDELLELVDVDAAPLAAHAEQLRAAFG